MGRYKDNFDLMKILFSMENNLARVLEVVDAQKSAPFEVGGFIYSNNIDSVVFKRVHSVEEDMFRKTQRLSSRRVIDDRAIAYLKEIKSYIRGDTFVSKYRKSYVKRDRLLLSIIEEMIERREYILKFHNEFTKLLRDSFTYYDLDKSKKLSDFHVHSNGAHPSKADLNSGSEDVVISYKSSLEGVLKFCSLYYIHEHVPRKITTFSGQQNSGNYFKLLNCC